jgi:hypothetical protein
MQSGAHYRVHKSAMYLTLAKQIHPTSSDTMSLRSILILFSHLRPRLRSDPIPSGFPTKFMYEFLVSLMHATHPTNLTHP